MTKENFLDAVLREVRFGWDRDEIRAELAEHLYEESAYLAERDGLTEAEAEAEAVRRMGDAKLLGKELNRAHNPWIGWLWIVTSVLLILSLFVYALGARDLYGELKDQYRKGTERVQAHFEQTCAEDGSLLFHLRCEETIEFEGFRIKFTDLYGKKEAKENGGDCLYIVYEQAGKDGRYFMYYLTEESFRNADGERYLPEKPYLFQALSPGVRTCEQGDILLTIDYDHPQIYVVLDQFGQKGEAVLDFSEGVEQLKEEGYFDEIT